MLLVVFSVLQFQILLYFSFFVLVLELLVLGLGPRLSGFFLERRMIDTVIMAYDLVVGSFLEEFIIILEVHISLGVAGTGQHLLA